MNKITRRAFLQVTGLTAAAAALSACSGESGSSAGFHVAVPNDTTNEARALQLLEKNGFFTLKEGAGITATKNDIADNPSTSPSTRWRPPRCPTSCRTRTTPSSTPTTPSPPGWTP